MDNILSGFLIYKKCHDIIKIFVYLNHQPIKIHL